MTAIHFTPDELAAVADALDWYDDTFRAHPDYEAHVANAESASVKVATALGSGSRSADR